MSTPTFGEMVRGVRVARGISQEALAESVGTTQYHISEIEQDGTIPYSTTVARMCAALGVEEETMQLLADRERMARARERASTRETRTSDTAKRPDWPARPCSLRVRPKRDGITDAALQALMRAAGERERVFTNAAD